VEADEDVSDDPHGALSWRKREFVHSQLGSVRREVKRVHSIEGKTHSIGELQNLKLGGSIC
jgi:hypothetical protein